MRAVERTAGTAGFGLAGLRSHVDRALTAIAGGDILLGMQKLVGSLRSARAAAGEAWRTLACEEIRAHPIREWVHQDPFTAHSFRKPRGYAGDAHLMDHIYGGGLAQWPHPSTTAGKLYFYTTNSPSCRAVRYCRTLLAKLIDDCASNRREPRILSIAAGHLREIELAKSATSRGFGRFVALDQDEATLREVEERYGALGIEAVKMSVKSLARGNDFSGEFDLVYAAGLFDYLSDPLAKRLVEVMFGCLRPGGTMMYANFLPGIEDVGYMESMMDWWLIYRTDHELSQLAAGLPREKIRSLTCTRDPDNNIAFVTIHRA